MFLNLMNKLLKKSSIIQKKLEEFHGVNGQGGLVEAIQKLKKSSEKKDNQSTNQCIVQKCPCCGASLKNDNLNQITTCEYCGSKINQ